MKSFFTFIVITWIVFFFSLLAPDVNALGIYPRHIEGLPGILFSPFLHGNLSHIVNNTIGIVIFAIPIISMHKNDKILDVMVFICVLSGLITWIISRNAIIIGASGLVYGLVSYGLIAAIKQRNMFAILYSIFIVLRFSIGLVSGLIPADTPVSWEAHAAGLVAGFLASGVFNDRTSTKDSPKQRGTAIRI